MNQNNRNLLFLCAFLGMIIVVLLVALIITFRDESNGGPFASPSPSPVASAEVSAAPVTSPTSSSSPTSPRPSAQPSGDLIVFEEPIENTVVTSPLKISGKARGTWFFEASFPVKLVDANGKVLVQAPAQAKADWMTAEFVPFEVELKFAKPATATGKLIFEKDNPSGLPENDAKLEVPVRFE